MTMNSGTDGAKMTNKHNGERGHGAGSVPKGIFLGAFAGFAAQAAVIVTAAFILSGLDDPATGFNVCAVLSSAAAGVFAGKTAASKGPDSCGMLCGVGSGAVMSAVLMLLSCIFVPETFTAWVPYTSLGVMFALCVLTAGKGKKERKRNAKTAAKRRKK